MTAKGTPSSWLGPLKFKVDGATVQLQPKRAAGEKVQTLILDLRRGTVQLSVHAQWLPDSTPVVHGVLGFVKLSEGALLALITKCKRVSAGQDEGIFHVTETHLVAHEATKTNNDDIRYAALLQEGLDAKDGAGSHMYFSPTANITASVQQQARQQAKAAKGKAPSLWAQSDKRFVWNAHLLQPLIDAGGEAFAMPVMVGYVGQVPDVELPLPGSDTELHMRVTLMSRVDRRRAGTLAWRSGLDKKGQCAHLIETELRVDVEERTAPTQPATNPAQDTTTASAPRDQAVAKSGSTGTLQAESSTDDQDQWSLVEKSEIPADLNSPASSAGASAPAAGAPRGVRRFALVQLRGSVPVLWCAPPNLEWSPRVRVCPDTDKQTQALQTFLTELRSIYKAVSFLMVPDHSTAPVICTLAALYDKTPPLATPPATAPSTKAAPATASLAPSQPLAVAGSDGSVYVAPSSTSNSTNSSKKSSNKDTQATGSDGASASGAQAEAAAGSLAAVLPGPGALAPCHVLLHDGPARRRLLDTVRSELQGGAHGSFRQQVGASSTAQEQQGVVFVSCPGPVDLTNLLQSDIATAWMERVLSDLGALSEGQSLRTHLPALDTAVNTLWANQGGVLADQLTGSSCLSSARVRTQLPPTWIGRTWETLQLAHRYYGHNFSAFERQDVLDMATGACKIDPSIAAPPRRPQKYTWLQLAAVCVAWSLFQVVLIFFAADKPTFGGAMYQIGTPALAAAGLLAWVWYTRETYAPKPLVAAEHIQPW